MDIHGERIKQRYHTFSYCLISKFGTFKCNLEHKVMSSSSGFCFSQLQTLMFKTSFSSFHDFIVTNVVWLHKNLLTSLDFSQFSFLLLSYTLSIQPEHVNLSQHLRPRLFRRKIFFKKYFPYFQVFGTTKNFGQTQKHFG